MESKEEALDKLLSSCKALIKLLKKKYLPRIRQSSDHTSTFNSLVHKLKNEKYQGSIKRMTRLKQRISELVGEFN